MPPAGYPAFLQYLQSGRVSEFEGRALKYFADFTPEAKDEAIANTLFLTWHNFVPLVAKGKADDHLLTITFYFACRQTRAGRVMRTVKASKFRDVWNHALVVTGAHLENFVSERNTVPDIVAFRIDTQAWLDSLTEHQRQRALELSDGSTTRELAERWHVSPPAVSLYRRQLHESYERFMATEA